MVPGCYDLSPVGDLLERPSFLQVSGEKGDHSTRACDDYGEPDDTPKRPAKTILFPHGDECEDDAGQAEDYNHPQAKAIIVSSGSTVSQADFFNSFSISESILL